MPKQVDHEERRRQIAEAVWLIAATRGLGAVSLRSVAAEAGISMGMVQHYFPSKEEMILLACEWMVALAEAGAREIIAEHADPHTARATIRAFCAHGLPLDEAKRLGASAWLAFVVGSATAPKLAAFIRHAWLVSQELVARQLAVARDGGLLAPALDPEAEARAILTLTDGLLAHLLVGHYSADDALAAIDHHLDRLFSAPEHY